MVKLIKISTELELSVHEFPDGDYTKQNKALCDLIGNGCRLYEHVMPRRLYTELHMRNQPTAEPGECVSMLIDEEGLLKKNMLNLVGSYLYETARHGYPIVGNILFVGEEWESDGIEFCGIEETTFQSLYSQLNEIVVTMKAAEEVLRK